MDELVKLVSTVGFPIAVAVFVLVRLDRALRDLRDAVLALTEHLRQNSPKG